MTQNSLLTLMLTWFQLIGIDNIISDTESYSLPTQKIDSICNGKIFLTDEPGYLFRFHLLSNKLQSEYYRLEIIKNTSKFLEATLETVGGYHFPAISIEVQDSNLGTYILNIHFKNK